MAMQSVWGRQRPGPPPIPPVSKASRFGKIDIWIAALGLLALIAMSEIGQTIAVICAIVIIGLPITFLLAALPTLFLVLLFIRITALITGLKGPVGWFAGLAVSVLVLAIPPYLYNQPILNDVDRLTSQDNLAPLPDIALKSLVLVSSDKNETKIGCSDLCRRLLLNGQVQEFGTRKIDAWAEPDPDTVIVTYSLQDRKTCPKPVFSDQLVWSKEAKQSGDMMMNAVLNGRCLIRASLKMSEASAVVASAKLDTNRKTRRFAVNRQGVFLPVNGHFVERQRQTAVKASIHFPLFIYTYGGGYGMRMGSEPMQKYIYRGGASQYKNGVSIRDYLQQNLRLNLDVKLPKNGLNLAANVRKALEAPNTKDGKLQILAQSFLSELAMFNRKNKLSVEDAELAMQLFRQNGIGNIDRVGTVIRNMMKSHPQYANEIADLAFAELRNIPVSDYRKGWSSGKKPPASAMLENAIMALPRSAITSDHRDIMDRIVSDERLGLGEDIVALYSVYGDEAVPVFMEMLARKPKRYSGSHYAAIKGLCNSGSAARVAVPKLKQIIIDGPKEARSNNVSMAIRALAVLGVDNEVIFTLIRDKIDPQQIDKRRRAFVRDIEKVKTKGAC